MERPEDMTDDTGLPQPGTEEPERPQDPDRDEDPTGGSGNVTVDEPTAPALAPEESQEESPG